ncbi:LysR substrate-binding domain-containing protein [Hydrogenophaga sp.]|uniref:LysR substrate-binding domain-containing protein n=1 Tax=Hydrogenophaga sp. TaxID=1904254 RepID=UPI00271BDDAC|nr:LysR substrate-binding domain-containing protein [Hydrogenophaga sp.]MDO9437910.1 LysR substrate-binding domain-containing protein [Hydrogenophaga sp.]
MQTSTRLSIALRAFEAAARNLSFTLAGQELHLTQGAVSRQIRLLEDFLGQPLFERLTRRVELTPIGRAYYLDVQQALRDLDKATQRAMRSSGRSVLSISVLPTFGTSWLMPRLSSFVEQHSDLDVRLATSIEVADFRKSDIDVAIRVGRVPGDTYPDNSPRVDSEIVDNWRGVMADYLAPDALLPVLAPSLLEGRAPIQTAADLLQFRLIHTVSRRAAWDQWLHAHRLSVPAGDRLTLSHYFMGIRAAEEGRGVAIVPSILVPKDSLERSLIAPVPADLRSAGNYYLVYQESRAEEPAILAFREWVLAETAPWREPA